MVITMATNKSVKSNVHTLLLERDYDRLIVLCEEDRQAWKTLRDSLYETDENLIWPAIESIAMLMGKWWQAGEEEKVRESIRRLFWALNDESGGIGWNAPQTIAEIIVLIPELVDPYGSMVVDRTMEEPLLVLSGLWAVGRLGKRIEGSINLFEEALLNTFKTEDMQVLGLACWAMGQAGFKAALPSIELLRNRQEIVRIYFHGDFMEKSLGQWSEESIQLIGVVVN